MAGFEATSGRNVSTYYGARDSGGTRGNVKTEGYQNEFGHNLDAGSWDVKFPIMPGGVWITKVDINFSAGPVTAYTIGGVAVFAATDAAPVFLAASNTGVIAQTGGTSGDIIVRYKNFA